MNWKYFMIHHSLTEDSNTVSWSAIRKYHKAQGWADIGYHFGVEWAGLEFEALVGRSLDMPGAHCKEGGMNTNAIGICIVGDFDQHPPSPLAIDVLIRRLLIPLGRIYKIPIDEEHIKFHREYATYKTCPGSQFQKSHILTAYNAMKV